MLQRIALIFLIGCLWGTVETYAQESTVFPREDYYQSTQTERSFSGVHWLEITEGIDYSESVRGERQEDENFFTDGGEKNKNKRSYDEENQVNNSSDFWSNVIKLLIIVLGIGIVALIISRFLGPQGLSKPRSKKVSESKLEVKLENIEDHIHESDLDKFIRQALEEQNYTLTIRLLYLAIIKELSSTKAIRWKRDKTNKDYATELIGQPYEQDFKNLTYIFERVWYGDHQLTETDFLLLKPKFDHLMSTIQTQALAQTSVNQK